IAMLNVATALFLLPQLVHMLTGVESAFSRSGVHLVESGIFWLLTGAVTWLAFDPFVQAMYCIMCFRAESSETGEDVRAGLRRIRAAGKVAAALMLVAIALPLRAQVDKPELHGAIEHAMQAHEYDWRLPPEVQPPASNSWFISFTDRMLVNVRKAMDS